MALKVLVLGTGNRKKGAELAWLLEPLGIEVRSLADYPQSVRVVEDGDTFGANARLKATQQARHLGTWVLGEDSGLMVDVLGGAPGVYSARYSGEGATDAANNRYLLAKLGDTPLDKRTAQFVCHAVVSDPLGQVRCESEGVCRGRILFEPRGSGGFGYDPLFEIVEYRRTFAELGPVVKAHLSHRSRAIRQLTSHLLQLDP